MRRVLAAVVLGAALTTACGGGAQSSRSSRPSPGDVPPATSPTEGCPDGTLLHGGDEPIASSPVADDAEFPWLQPDPTVVDGFDDSRIISGGPPPDGIRPIEAPCFEPTDAAADWLGGTSPVLAIDVNGDRRAYPLAIMTQHEIVNDVVGGEPVVVTYCPLCNSGLAFHREVGDEILDFGTSGRLFQSNLVMYDRQHRNLWLQFTGRAVVGDPWAGTELERIPTALLSYEEFADAAPDGQVLAPETEPNRDYGRNPYPGYESRASSFLFQGPLDDRLPPNTRVVGIAGEDGDGAKAIPLEVLREDPVRHLDLDGSAVVVWWAPGAASALEANTVDGGRDVGQTGAFHRVVDGRTLTFGVHPDRDDRFVDEETGSAWNVTGAAVAGPLAGTQLRRIAVDDTFWFVWFAFRPATTVVDATT